MIEVLDCKNFIIEKVNKSNLPLLLQGIEDNKEYMGEFFPWIESFDINKELKKSENVDDSWFKNPNYNFCIMDKNINLCLGKIGIEVINRSPNAGVYNLNYWVYEAYQGKGIASEAVKKISDYLLNEKSTKRVEILAITNNIKSMKVAKKAGFIFESLEYNFDYFYNQSVDAYHFVRLSDVNKQSKIIKNEVILKKLYNLKY